MNDTDHDSLTNIYSSEILCATWISISLILLTVSLLFYDMTKRSSLELHFLIAAIFAITLMGLSIFSCVSGVSNYEKRIKKQIEESKNEFKQEKQMSKTVMIFNWILIIIEVCICLSIINSIKNKYFKI